MTTIDGLLAHARIPTSPADGFDVGAALRRLAEDAADATPAPDMLHAARAGQQLSVVCRWYLNRPDAAEHVDRLAQDPDASTELTEDQLDVDGAVVFACLLYLTEHFESAQFWWQLAAGAGHRGAAYCLHLHHLARGESREAQHWIHQVTDTLLEPSSPALDDDFFTNVERMTRFVRTSGCSRATAPTGELEMEVNRLATSGADSCIILSRPDRRLAAQFHQFNAQGNTWR
ncbi:hypothetical protein [Streptomyces sp. ODS28]|uniref:hypothetical protein n=1 Tax=Streptomyces sp. ODS28 TaxID=3136688 RepID=UPI0031E724F0